MYRKYVETYDGDYLKAAVAYDIEAKVVTEDVVQLLHKKRDPQRARPLRMSRIKDINFTSPSEVPSLLSTQLVVARSELRVDAPAFVPSRSVPQIEKVGDAQKGQAQGPNIEQESRELVTDEPALIHGHEPTEQEMSAAKKIQATYRKYRRRREELTRAFGRGLKAQKNTVFAKCLKNVYASNWGKTPYRTMYLWALPRLVVCLDKAMAIAHDFKTKTKVLLLKEGHDHLEELGKKTSQISALLKAGHLLQKRIEPDAVMHQARNRDRAALKKAVLDVKSIIDGLPVQAPDEIQEDTDFVYELVVVEKQQVPKPGKPDLNTEDLDLCYY